MKTTKDLFDTVYRAIACTPNNNPHPTNESNDRIRTAIDTLKKTETDTTTEIPDPHTIDRAAALLETILDEKHSSAEDRRRYLDQIRDRTPAEP